MRSIEGLLAAFAGAVLRCGGRYALAGDVAAAAWAQGTVESGFEALVDLDSHAVHGLAGALADEGLRGAPEDLEAALRGAEAARITDRHSLFEVVVWPASSGLEGDMVRTAVPVPVRGVVLRVTCIEDTIANKLRFGAKQDVEDAEAIYARQRDHLDMALLEERCRALGVAADLASLRERVDGVD